jgi:hypothetical protein
MITNQLQQSLINPLKNDDIVKTIAFIQMIKKHVAHDLLRKYQNQ